MAFKLLAIQELLLVVCLFGWFWFEIWIQLSLFNFFASRWKKKKRTKTVENDKLDCCWFSHEVIKNSHRRIFDAPEFFLSWRIRVAESECSNQFLLRKGSSLFCDHSELEFLSFCLMPHSWRPRDVRNKKVEKVTYMGRGG